MAKSKKNRIKNSVSVKKPYKKKETVRTVQKKLVAEQFMGPIPPPQILAEYEQFLPSSADRILCMAEKETAHRQTMETKAIDAEIEGLRNEAKDIKRGQFCGLIIGIIALLSGTYTSINGFPWAGSFIGAGGVIGLVSAFIVGRKNAPDNNAHEHSKEVITTQKR